MFDAFIMLCIVYFIVSLGVLFINWAKFWNDDFFVSDYLIKVYKIAVKWMNILNDCWMEEE